ncbi:hypothetical protein PSAC2689_20208 [Paraburkholderia sacchari]
MTIVWKRVAKYAPAPIDEHDVAEQHPHGILRRLGAKRGNASFQLVRQPSVICIQKSDQVASRFLYAPVSTPRRSAILGLANQAQRNLVSTMTWQFELQSRCVIYNNYFSGSDSLSGYRFYGDKKQINAIVVWNYYAHSIRIFEVALHLVPEFLIFLLYEGVGVCVGLMRQNGCAAYMTHIVSIK